MQKKGKKKQVKKVQKVSKKKAQKKSVQSLKTSKKGAIFDTDKDVEQILSEPEEFLESEEHPGLHEDAELKIHLNEKEADVYTEEGREELTVDEGEIAPWEEGFAEGADHEGADATCANCDKVLGDRDEMAIVEKLYKGNVLKFCSSKCARAGPKGTKES